MHVIVAKLYWGARVAPQVRSCNNFWLVHGTLLSWPTLSSTHTHSIANNMPMKTLVARQIVNYDIVRVAVLEVGINLLLQKIVELSATELATTTSNLYSERHVYIHI